MNIDLHKVNDLIELSIQEDLGNDLKDITSDILFDNSIIETKIFAKEEIIVCGVELIEYIYNRIDETIDIELHQHDGKLLKDGDIIAKIKGNSNTVLKGERLILNFLQRLSGISTKTKQFIKKLENQNINILDTRKTIPGYRYLDKYAVKIGGGKNHRMNLYDMVMIKDNHKNIIGGLEKSIKKIKKNIPVSKKIDVEVENIKEAKIAARHNVDIIMLDNMSNKKIKLASKEIKKINPSIKIEVSGKVTIERVKSLSKLNIDYISIGALTHSVRAVDISMEIIDA